VVEEGGRMRGRVMEEGGEGRKEGRKELPAHWIATCARASGGGGRMRARVMEEGGCAGG
jgi:hypothetical protein